MKSLVLRNDKILTLENRKMPGAVEDSVLIKVVACGVCGSDIPRGFGGKAYGYPLVMGHEFSGVVALDSLSGEFRAGDPVAVFPLVPCRQCVACQTGDYAQCEDYNYFGSRCDGGLSEYVYVPEFNLFRIPDHVDILHAAMTEPAAVALHGVRKIKISGGETGVVFGGGPIGNMTAQWLRIRGCERVIVIDVENRKLDVAAGMGFETINALEADPVGGIMELTDGKGASCVVEAVGLPATFLQAIQSARRFGQVVFMGNIQGDFTIGEKYFSDILRKELTIYGTWNSKIVPVGLDDWSTVLKYMDKEFQVAPLISDTPTLEEGPAIFESILAKDKFHNKVIFKVASES